MISAKDKDSYVTLEFQNLKVTGIIITSLKSLSNNCYFVQIDYWFNRLDIFEGSMKIGEVFGNSDNKLMKSISGTSLFIDFKKQYYKGTVEILASIKYNKMVSDCQAWLDLKNNLLKSPNEHRSKINCSWLLTGNFDSYITLDFKFFEVTHRVLFNFKCVYV